MILRCREHPQEVKQSALGALRAIPVGDILDATGIGGRLSRLIAPKITAYAAQDGDVIAQLNALRSAQGTAESSGRRPSRVAGGRPVVRAWAIHGHIAGRIWVVAAVRRTACRVVMCLAVGAEARIPVDLPMSAWLWFRP